MSLADVLMQTITVTQTPPPVVTTSPVGLQGPPGLDTDGGAAATVFLAAQNIDGGDA